MSDPAPQNEQDPSTEEEKPAPPEEGKPEAESDPAGGRAPWYRRPVPLIGILVLVLILVAVLAPVVADETPVGLTPEGEANAEAGGWEAQEDDEAFSTFGGLVTVDPITLTQGGDTNPTGYYVYSTVKIPAMLPLGVVENQMQDNALEQLDQNGVRVTRPPQAEAEFDENGHDVTIQYFNAVAENDQLFLAESEVELFIATWRCSLLGSYALAVGAVPVIDEGIIGSEGIELDEIENDLLAHTKCEG